MPIKALTAALTLELLSKDGDEPPTEFRVFKKGVTETSKGMFKFTDGSTKKVAEAAKRYGNDYPVDYNHAMHSFFSVDPAEAGKAAGWFTPTIREGELWATDIRWTKKAKQMLSDREYRYFSPTFRHSRDGEIEELLSVALTNTPATYGMKPLMASAFEDGLLTDEPETPRMETLLTALGLSKNATEAEAVAALAALTAAQREALQITGASSNEALLGILKGWKAGMEQVAGLSKRVQELETEKKTARQDALLAQASREGKVPPAQVPFLKTLSLEQLEAYLSVAVPVAPIAAPAQQPKDGDLAALSLTPEETQLAQLMGLKPEEVAKAKAERGGKVVQAAMTSKPAASSEAKA